MLWGDHAVDARALRRAEEHAEVLGILQRVDHEHEPGLTQRVEVEQELVELHAGLALDDRDDALMVLDGRDALDLHRIDVADEDAASLGLGDEVLHRTGLRAALVRDEEPLQHASGADRLEHRVWTGDRLSRLVRGGRAGARTRRRTADLLGVLRATGTPSATARTHRPALTAAEPATGSEAAGRRTEHATTGRSRALPRDPTRSTERRDRAALLLLAPLIRGELAAL